MKLYFDLNTVSRFSIASSSRYTEFRVSFFKWKQFLEKLESFTSPVIYSKFTTGGYILMDLYYRKRIVKTELDIEFCMYKKNTKLRLFTDPEVDLSKEQFFQALYNGIRKFESRQHQIDVDKIEQEATKFESEECHGGNSEANEVKANTNNSKSDADNDSIFPSPIKEVEDHIEFYFGKRSSRSDNPTDNGNNGNNGNNSVDDDNSDDGSNEDKSNSESNINFGTDNNSESDANVEYKKLNFKNSRRLDANMVGEIVILKKKKKKKVSELEKLLQKLNSGMRNPDNRSRKWNIGKFCNRILTYRVPREFYDRQLEKSETKKVYVIVDTSGSMSDVSYTVLEVASEMQNLDNVVVIDAPNGIPSCIIHNGTRIQLTTFDYESDKWNLDYEAIFNKFGKPDTIIVYADGDGADIYEWMLKQKINLVWISNYGCSVFGPRIVSKNDTWMLDFSYWKGGANKFSKYLNANLFAAVGVGEMDQFIKYCKRLLSKIR